MSAMQRANPVQKLELLLREVMRMIWGISFCPRNTVTTKKTRALKIIRARPDPEKLPVTTTLASTANSSTPSTSSMTAAPRITLADAELISPAAPIKPAVIPTDVAASMAPTNQPSIPFSLPSSFQVSAPNTTGSTTPTTATLVALGPTLTRSRMSDSRPTRNSRRTTASSEE